MSVPSEVFFRTYYTRRNLPSHTGRRRGEANFLGAFLKSFMAQSRNLCWCGRHFAIPDCGVADCIIVEPRAIDEELSTARLLAFEAKLADWRQALKQAYRYRYYADAAIVILPAQGSRMAIAHRDLFRQMGVGLWTFNQDSGAILPRVAVKRGAPLSSRKRGQALLRIERYVVQFRQLREKANAL